MRYAAIIEARMGSSRLHGKVMLPLCGKPVIKCMIERLQRCKELDDIIVATTVNKMDDSLCSYMESVGCKYFRGSEEDVLNRVVRTAKKYDVDVVVETTGDCPLIDPAFVDQVVKFYKKNEYDLVSNCITEHKNLPVGLDTIVISREILEKIDKQYGDPFIHEHVCCAIVKYPEDYKIGYIDNDPKINRPEYRWTLDTIDDYKFIKTIFQELYPKNASFDTYDILNLCRKKPKLPLINKHVTQKSYDKEYFDVGIIGCGRIAFTYDYPKSKTMKSHYGGIKDNPTIRLKAICEKRDNALKKVIKDYSLKKNTEQFKDYKKMLKDVKLDVLVIATPPELRDPVMAETIAKTKIKIVFIEKPVSIDYKTAKKFVAILEKSGKTVYIDYSREFLPEFEILRLQLQDKKVQRVLGTYCKGIYNGGSHWIDLITYFFGFPKKSLGFSQSRSLGRDPTLGFEMIYPEFTISIRPLDYNQYMHSDLEIFLTDGRIRIINGGQKIEYYKVIDSPIFPGYKNLQYDYCAEVNFNLMFKRIYAKIVSELQAPGSFRQDSTRVVETYKIIGEIISDNKSFDNK